MRLARKYQAITMPPLFNLEGSKAMNGARECRGHTVYTLFSKTVSERMWEHVVTSADPLAVYHDDKDAAISAIV